MHKCVDTIVCIISRQLYKLHHNLMLAYSSRNYTIYTTDSMYAYKSKAFLSLSIIDRTMRAKHKQKI